MKTFNQSLKKRNIKLKKLRILEDKVRKLRSEVIDIEHICISLKKWGDKFERSINFNIDFSGSEE